MHNHETNKKLSLSISSSPCKRRWMDGSLTLYSSNQFSNSFMIRTLDLFTEILFFLSLQNQTWDVIIKFLYYKLLHRLLYNRISTLWKLWLRWLNGNSLCFRTSNFTVNRSEKISSGILRCPNKLSTNNFVLVGIFFCQLQGSEVMIFPL